MNSHFLKALWIFALFSAFAEAAPDGAGTVMSDGSLKDALARVAEYPGGEQGKDKVLVLGLLQRPGFYQPKEYNLLSVVSAAGGRTEFASSRRFYVLRSGVLTAFRLPEKEWATFEVKNGDTIFIENSCTNFGNSVLNSNQ